MSTERARRGTLWQRGGRWSWQVDAGKRPAQRCTAARCARRAGWLDDGRQEQCPRCGGALEVALERRRVSGTARTKTDARQAIQAILGAQHEGTYAVPSSRTVDAWLDEWLKAQRGHLKPSTHTSYASVARRYLRQPLGHMPPKDLTTARLEACTLTS